MDKKDFLSNNYLEISQRDLDWGLHVVSSGHAVSGNSKECPRLYGAPHLSPAGRVYDCFNIIFIKSGSILLYPDVSKPEHAVLKEGALIITVPGIRHRYHANPATGVEEHWIKFNGYHAKGLAKKGFLPSTTAFFAKGEHSVSLNSFESVQFLAEDVDDWDVQIKTRPFLTTIISSIRPLQNKSIAPVVEKARSYMTRNAESALDFADFAKKNGMTPRNFRRVFKHAVGQSPLQYFLSVKVNKAKALLESGKYSVKEVAAHLGFDDQYYFSRVFKKKGLFPCFSG